ncbi:MAG: hypothetical protein LUH08_03955, partial [Ruminococcus sp.]|nr:hypothetical protein [Ruminococcus sp.]
LYTRLYKSREAKTPVPHLIIIIDEFAELKKEEPDFMRELISVAQVGRSLGVHLILATQKPSGTVDDNIRTNSKFHLCLRVQDRQDSMDMLHKPDAAYITQAGRSYLQVGNDEIYELFQSGWSGAIYDNNTSANETGIAKMITLTGKTAIVGSQIKMKQKEKERVRWYDAIIKATDYIYRQSDFEKPIAEMSPTQLNELAGAVSAVLSEQYDYGTADADVRAVENFIKLMSEKECKSGAEANNYVQEASNAGIKLPEIKEKTQLEVLVKYLKNLAIENGFANDIKLWLPLLPEKLLYSDLATEAKETFKGNEFSLNAVVGMYDDPENQLQMPVKIDFATSGHLALCGTVVSGKSTFMQTLVYALAKDYTPDALNIYILDFSNRMLSCFERLPHTGGVMYENDADKISKFFALIEKIITERQSAFGGGNYGQFVRAYGRKYPAVLVVIDNFANFREKTSGAYDAAVLRLAREGVSCGVYLAISSAGFGMNEIPTRIADNIRNVVCLEMGDKYKYMEVLRTARLSVFPETDIKGRGLIKVDERILEFQTALGVDAPDDYSRCERIEKWSETLRQNWKGKQAVAVPCIPKNPSYSDLKKTSGFDKASQSACLVPLGYNQTDASLECIDLEKTYCYVISGRERTGKTNVLRIIMQGAAQKNGKLFVIECSTSKLRHQADLLGAEYISSEEGIFAFLNEIKEPFVERNRNKHELLNSGMTESEIFAQMQKKQPYFIFVASLEEFLSMTYEPSEKVGKMSGFVENIFDKGALHNIYFFAATDPDNYSTLAARQAYKQFAKYKKGIHLGGCLDKQKLFSVTNIPYTEQSKAMPKGVAITPLESDESVVKKIVIPLFGGDEE